MTWQPIETAPKDGTRVDLWVYGDRVCDACWSGSRGQWVNPQPTTSWGMAVMEDDVVCFIDRATHWMPITPPEPT